MTKKFTLGRGLDALISTEAVRTSGSSSIGEISLGLIEANPNQPRREFSEESLRELADPVHPHLQCGCFEYQHLQCAYIIQLNIHQRRLKCIDS